MRSKRNTQFSQVTFGPGQATNQQLGVFLLDDSGDPEDEQDKEVADSQSRSLYIQAGGVNNAGGVLGGSLNDGTGPPAQPLFLVAEITWGSHGKTSKILIDLFPGCIMRIPLAGAYTKVVARCLKQIASASPTKYADYNAPPARLEQAPAQPVDVAAFIGERPIGSKQCGLIRKAQSIVNGGGGTEIPVAWGARSCRLLGNPATLTFIIQQDMNGGLFRTYGPFPANAPPVEIPSGATFLDVLDSGGAGTSDDFEVEFFLDID